MSFVGAIHKVLFSILVLSTSVSLMNCRKRSSSNVKESLESQSTNTSDLGFVLKENDNTIQSVTPGSIAEKSGAMAGDRLKALSWESTAHKTRHFYTVSSAQQLQTISNMITVDQVKKIEIYAAPTSFQGADYKGDFDLPENASTQPAKDGGRCVTRRIAPVAAACKCSANARIFLSCVDVASGALCNVGKTKTNPNSAFSSADETIYEAGLKCVP